MIGSFSAIIVTVVNLLIVGGNCSKIQKYFMAIDIKYLCYCRNINLNTYIWKHSLLLQIIFLLFVSREEKKN